MIGDREIMIKEKIVSPFVKTLVNSNALDKIEDNMMPLKRLMAYYRCAIMEVETKFNVLNEEFSLEYDRNPIETIKTRLKSTESIIKKLVRRNFPLTVDSIEANLNDIAGVRVVCSFLEDIYLLADCLLQQDDVKLIQVKDYIKNPKPNGYRSLHLIIEVPIYLKDEKKNITKKGNILNTKVISQRYLLLFLVFGIAEVVKIMLAISKWNKDNKDSRELNLCVKFISLLV